MRSIICTTYDTAYTKDALKKKSGERKNWQAGFSSRGKFHKLVDDAPCFLLDLLMLFLSGSSRSSAPSRHRPCSSCVLSLRRTVPCSVVVYMQARGCDRRACRVGDADGIKMARYQTLGFLITGVGTNVHQRSRCSLLHRVVLEHIYELHKNIQAFVSRAPRLGRVMGEGTFP